MSWVEQMRAELLAVLADVTGGASSVGIADFPRHLNVGDQAIWIGERHAFDALGATVTCAFDRTNYDPARIRERLGDAPLCIHGGGNFGDLYMTHQQLREAILGEFTERPLIQLAQSIEFVGVEALERTRRLISAHGDVTLIVRDRTSEQRARECFDARVVLAPDMAFGVGPIARLQAGSVPVVRQARTDKESQTGEPGGAETFDWLEEPTERRQVIQLAAHRARLALTSGRRESGRRAPTLASARLIGAYDAFARWSVDRGARMLCRGTVAITDRLHGHILCTLMGIDHVVLPDRHGKIRAFWEAWSQDSPHAHWAESVDEAVDEARQLAQAGHGAHSSSARS